MARAVVWRFWRWRLRFWYDCIDRARRIRLRRDEAKDRQVLTDQSLESVARGENVAPIWRLPNGEGIAGRDLALLVEGKWLNSEIINSYFSLLKIQADRIREKDSSKLRVHCFSSFFYTKLQISGYEGVRRWTKKTNIFEHDLLLFPINHDNVHWTLVAAHLKKQRMEYYDSSLCKSKTRSYVRFMTMIDEYLRKERARKGIQHVPGSMELCIVDCVPQQGDGSSCGVFICAYADHLTRGQSPPFSFTSLDISTIQKRMSLQMLRGSVL